VLEEQRAFIEALAWSPAGDQLVSAALDGTVRLWDMAAALQSGRATAAARLVLQAHTEPARDVLWGPDGTTLLSAGDDGAVRAWDAVNGKQLDQLTGHADTVLSVSWSPDGSRLAAGVDDATIRVWSVPSRDDAAGGRAGLGAGTSPRILKGHRGEVNAVAWSPDGAYLASAGGLLDGRILLWTAPDFDTARVLSGHSGAVSSLAWSPDGSRLVSASWDTTLRIWDREGRPLQILNEPAGWVLSVAWSPDGSRVAAGERDGGLRVWDAVDGNPVAALRGHTDQVHAVAWSPDGTQLLSASWDGTLRLWDAAARREIETLNVPGAPTSVAWSPDGRFWAVAAAFHDDRVHILDAGTGRELAVLAGHQDYVTMVAWSPDGTRLATASADGTVRVWGLPEAP
jgi:WD40 repeat protein